MSDKIENIDDIVDDDDDDDDEVDVGVEVEVEVDSDSDDDVNESDDDDVNDSDDYQESEDESEEHDQDPEQYISKTKIQHSIVVEDIYKDSENFYKEYNSELNILSKKLTKYEITALIGIRADQISLGSNTFLNEKELEKVKDITNPELIAEQELFSKPCKLPFIIRRPIANNKYEYSKLSDLIF